ncbi:MAG: hypothetical protein WBA76_00190 [Phormidesmis sp.]
MNIKKVRQLGVVLLGAFVVSGCPSPMASQLMLSSGSGSQDAIAQEVVSSEAALPQRKANAKDTDSVNFDVCANVENWQRPSEAEQAKRVSNNPRYSEALASSSTDDSLKRESTQFWDHQAISFTTYGLSARVEPENLSGVWTATDEMANCYQPETTVAINQGDRAETWLLNHRISDLQWEGDRYLMTVEPASTGLQVIQFDRVDEMASLPLEVVTTNGSPVDTMSGDWQ